MAFLLDCAITAHQEVARDHRRLVLRSPEIARAASPGQFCMLEVREGFYPFLRRPMSIERIFHDGISILYKITGLGTRLLSELSVGGSINVQGPLGTPFPLAFGEGRVILVGGGIGIAPLPGLAEALIRSAGITPEVVIAAKNESDLLCEREFSQMGCAVLLVTNDGTAGLKGLAPDGLVSLDPDENTCVFTCGPQAMMRSIHQVCLNTGSPCYASLEAFMACGDGVCMGCVVESTAVTEDKRMVRVCREGPVFDTRTLIWSDGRIAL